jgi:hypothetical protein
MGNAARSSAYRDQLAETATIREVDRDNRGLERIPSHHCRRDITVVGLVDFHFLLFRLERVALDQPPLTIPAGDYAGNLASGQGKGEMPVGQIA